MVVSRLIKSHICPKCGGKMVSLRIPRYDGLRGGYQCPFCGYYGPSKGEKAPSENFKLFNTIFRNIVGVDYDVLGRLLFYDFHETKRAVEPY